MTKQASPTEWRGSERTAEKVRKQIRDRFGEDAAEQYDPRINARTFNGWRKVGFVVKKGEKALKSITLVEKKNKKGKVIATYPKTVCLFFQTQVEPMGEPKSP